MNLIPEPGETTHMYSVYGIPPPIPLFNISENEPFGSFCC